MKQIAKISGLAYLMIFITGIYSNFFILEKLTNSTDSVIIAESILNNSQQLIYGLIGFSIMLIFDILLIWSLFAFLFKVNKRLAFLMSVFRFINAFAFGVALLSLIEVYNVVVEHSSLSMIIALDLQDQVMLLLNRFDTIWAIGLLFFSIHLLFLGWLILKSKHIPNVFGLLIILASLGYLIDTIAALLLDNYSAYEDIFAIIVIMPAFIGELSFTIWLLFYGFKRRSKSMKISLLN